MKNTLNKQQNGSSVEKKKKSETIKWVFLGLYIVFVVLSYIFRIDAGIAIGDNFLFFTTDMAKLFPPAFILVGLFTVWVDRATVEKFFGEASGAKGYFAAILLAFTMLYPFIVVLPMAAALAKKGGRLSIILTYLGASAVCRIPMTIFEASFLGLKFTIIRYAVSLPLIIISSIMIEKLVGKNYFTRNDLFENLDT